MKESKFNLFKCNKILIYIRFYIKYKNTVLCDKPIRGGVIFKVIILYNIVPTAHYVYLTKIVEVLVKFKMFSIILADGKIRFNT